MGYEFCHNKISSYLADIMSAMDKALVERHREIKEYAIANSNIQQQDSPELIARQEQLKALRLLPRNSIIQDAIDQTILEINNIKQKETVVSQINSQLFDILAFCCGNINYWDETPWTDKHPIYRELVAYVKVSNGEIKEIKLRV